MELLPTLLGWAVLLPLIAFVVNLLLGPRLGHHGRTAGTVSVLAILGSCLLSFVALAIWLWHHPPGDPHGEGHARYSAFPVPVAYTEPAYPELESTRWISGDEPHSSRDGDHEHHASVATAAVTGDWYTLGEFGQLRLTIGYYIDALTVAMFCMVTFVALCIHVYATGYMHDELHDVTDHEVHLASGQHLKRPGRYPRFFQFLSLFCFSMLGLVVSGNIAMTFVFWELVGICSYFLIGFYVERPSASTAANKAFIVNRVGDFGMIIGLMALWGSLGTFAFGDIHDRPGLFSLVRPAEEGHRLVIPAGMAAMSTLRADSTAATKSDAGYGLLILAGLGIFCGCVGKSAQFPLHVWLPDAMEGPTPVSALVHSATMVAAGVYLVARFYPVFTPEVLLIIAFVGTITLLLAATIALTATDIKRVLAYSTVSQLGYMMMSLGVGGWLAGVLHLFTHAFFKSMLFMCSGSVIHAVHTNDMTSMGGLARKMPWTAFTMLIGCLAIAGAGIPFVIGMSGYYSKDSILEQAYLFGLTNPGWGSLFFYAAAGGATLTAFYMFRLWFLTFTGEPRDRHRYDHAHESPFEMVAPLVVLATLAVAVAWSAWLAIGGAILSAFVFFAIHLWLAARSAPHNTEYSSNWLTVPMGCCAVVLILGMIWHGSNYRELSLSSLLEQARPAGTLEIGRGLWSSMTWPDEHASHAPEIVTPVTLIASATALGGILLAAVFYLWRLLSADDVRRQFSWVYMLLWNKYWFDELYDFMFVRPTHFLAGLAAGFDRRWIDGLIDGLAHGVAAFARVWDLVADRGVVDGFVNTFAAATHAVGVSLRGLQTGSLRQYVMFIVVATLLMFVLVSFFWGYAFAS